MKIAIVGSRDYPHLHHVQSFVRLVDATCQHVLPADAAVDAARMIYHQDHAETCAIWCRGHIETNWRAWAHEEAE